MNMRLLASLGASALLSATLCTQLMASEMLRFQVFLDDKPIGEHSFRIAESGNVKRVNSRAAFDVDWYNDQLGWVGLASEAGKGRRLTYRRT